MTTNPSHRALSISLRPVTSEIDVLQLAQINEQALEGDPLKQWMALFTDRTEWSTTVQAVTEALTDPNYSLVKAVIPDAEVEGGEKIVGFVHWYCGYITLEKVDPFAQQTKLTGEVKDIKDVASNVAEELAEKAEELQKMPTRTEEAEKRARRLKTGERKYVETRNHYIGAIRGKKHMFIRRIMVLPEYQGFGIGRMLMDVVTGEADRQNIVCWLFARPAGLKLYERVGFKVIGVTEMDEPEMEFLCPSTKSMMRTPQPIKQ